MNGSPRSDGAPDTEPADQWGLKERETLFTIRKERSKFAWRCLKGTVLGLLTIPGALLTGAAVGSVTYAWCAWFGLLPLFFAIRKLGPAQAALAGALWSVFFYVSLTAGVAGLSLTPQSCGSMAIVLMLYTGIGALLTRWIGFSPTLMALGWILVELALTPLGLNQGLLAATQDATPYLRGLSCLLGYVLVAFIIAGANAWLVLLLSNVPTSSYRYSPSEELPKVEMRVLSKTQVYSLLITLFRGYPRAPPLPTMDTVLKYLPY